MAIHIAQIGKHGFVCGLFWQSLSRPRELGREAADLGKKIDADLVVVRRDQSTAQAGFAQSREGASRALYSLGAAVSKTLALEGAYYDGVQQPVHNWLGAFRLDGKDGKDGYWAYFAVRDANFLPNGDFVGSRDEVIERLQTDYALGGWNVVIGEAELAGLGFHNFNARTLDGLLPRRGDGSVRVHGWWRLRQINRRRPRWVVGLAVAAALAIVLVTAWAWHAWQARAQSIERERMAVAARLVAQQQARQARPWMVVAAPAAVLGRCARQLEHLTPGGWRLEEYVCVPGRVRYTWSRQASTVAMLQAQVPDAQVAPSGDRASFERALAPVAGTGDGTGEALLPSARALAQLMSRLQGVGVPFRVVPRKSAPPPGQPAGTAAWLAYDFTLDARGIEPQQIAALLDQPGVRVEKATYRGVAWLIEGVMYAK